MGDATPLLDVAAIRQRPGMYIGSTEVWGLTTLVAGLLGRSVDHYRVRGLTHIFLRLEPDGYLTFSDDSPGPAVTADLAAGSAHFDVAPDLPSEPWGERTTLGLATYRAFAGLPMICALSEHVHLEVQQDGAHWVQDVAQGQPVAPARRTGATTASRMALGSSFALSRPLWIARKGSVV
jgi:DNA gyrase subunit B